MSLIYNNKAILQARGSIKYNNTLLTQVDYKANSAAAPVTVWQCDNDITFGCLLGTTLYTINCYVSYIYDDDNVKYAYNFKLPETSASTDPVYITLPIQNEIVQSMHIANGIWSMADDAIEPAAFSHEYSITCSGFTNPTDLNLRFEFSGTKIRANWVVDIANRNNRNTLYYSPQGYHDFSIQWTKTLILPANTTTPTSEIATSGTVSYKTSQGTDSSTGSALIGMGTWQDTLTGGQQCEQDVFSYSPLSGVTDPSLFFSVNPTWSIYNNDTGELLATGSGNTIKADIGV